MWDLKTENYVSSSLGTSTPKTPALIPQGNRSCTQPMNRNREHIILPSQTMLLVSMQQMDIWMLVPKVSGPALQNPCKALLRGHATGLPPGQNYRLMRPSWSFCNDPSCRIQAGHSLPYSLRLNTRPDFCTSAWGKILNIKPYYTANVRKIKQTDAVPILKKCTSLCLSGDESLTTTFQVHILEKRVSPALPSWGRRWDSEPHILKV